MYTQQKFDIPFRQFIDANGQQIADIPTHCLDQTLLQECYRQMVLTRSFDSKAIALQRTGQLGTFPSTLGQEAIGVGIGKAMHYEDVLAPYYRDCATLLIRGNRPAELMQYWAGDERGNNGSGPPHDLPYCVPIATQMTQAAGVASAFKIRGEKRVVVATIGDGGTSKGDFYEAINVAGAWQLPMITVVNNNQWAISTPRDKQTACATFAQKAFAAGIPTEQVDGNDVVAMYDAMYRAHQRAMAGKGPTLIEAITYRLCDHTTADDASRYRGKDEVHEAWQRDPVKRMQTWLAERGWWDQQAEQQWLSDCQQLIDDAVSEYQKVPPQPASAMFDHLYDTLPKALDEQYQEVLEKESRLLGEQRRYA